jgi:hypothetical protein
MISILNQNTLISNNIAIRIQKKITPFFFNIKKSFVFSLKISDLHKNYNKKKKSNLGLDSILAEREMGFLLLLTDSLLGLLERSQSSAHSTGLLDTEIQGDELLLLVKETELFTLGLVDDGQDTGNVLASFTTVL